SSLSLSFLFPLSLPPLHLHSFPTRRSSDLTIFKRFYRVPNRALPQVRGTRLGLFLVRTIAKRHGGRVTAQSAGQGKGSTVILELDRKSTRLNSSHRTISYAVFCLKKKKKIK